MMATHLLRDRAPCRLLVPESGAPAVKKVIHKGRKAQKTADGEAFLLPCSLFTCQLGSLSAGLVRKPWGHGPMDEDLCFGVPRGAMGRDHGALSPWGRVPKVDMKRDFFSWNGGVSYCFLALKGSQRAGSCRALCTDEVRSKQLMHTENSVEFGVSLL